MNRTDTLLRLKRFRVDEMKRRIASIEAMKADLERKLADLDDNVAREKQRAGDSDIGRLAFPSFLRSIEARRENLRTTLKEIEREQAVRPARPDRRLPGSQVAGNRHRAAGQAAGGNAGPPRPGPPGRDGVGSPSAQAHPAFRLIKALAFLVLGSSAVLTHAGYAPRGTSAQAQKSRAPQF